MTDDVQPLDFDHLARKVRRGIVNAYRATLIGNSPEITRTYADRARDPQIGDLVAEQTTAFMAARSDLDAVGLLEEIAWERVVWDDPEFVWDEDVEGQPHPTERVFYIRTFDGRRFRWTNASFVAAVDDYF